jgi:multisubunit Na+/H+ antiporter MnhB subunit
MTMALAFDASLGILVLAVAGWTIAARETFAAVVGFVVYGLLVAIVWVRLVSVDVALTEAAVGAGMTGVLLIGAAARLCGTEAPAAAERPGTTLHVAAAVLSARVAAALAAVVVILPEPAPTLAPEAVANLPATGLGNAVTGVLLAFRAVDTLLESVVLVFALLGVWSLAPDRLWGGRPGLEPHSRPDGALAFLARVLAPMGIMVGIHLFWVGADDPGGKFQAGTILAATWILVMMAGLEDAPPISRRWLRLVLVAGPATFLAIGFAGFVMAGSFLAYPAALAKPLIIVIEAAMTLSVATTLALLVAGPPERGPRP